MVKYTLRAICLVIISLIVLGQMARADVTHNITFTVKNNGVVEAVSDLGAFTDDITVNVTGDQIPLEFKRGYTQGEYVTSDYYYLETPVGYNVLSEPGPSAQRLPMVFKLNALYARSAGSLVSGGNVPTCDFQSDIGNGRYYLTTAGKELSYTGCSTKSAGSGGPTDMYFTFLSFSFMEETGGKNTLGQLKFPAGVYRFQPQLFRFVHVKRPYPTVYGNWYINVTVIIEPSIASVSIPTALPLDVAVENANQLTGQGSVLATVTGTLGSNLKILPASANNGQLVKGAERIPYTLSVVPLSGDNKSRLLIDGSNGGAQQEVVIETYEKRDQYQFRFDASFATTLSNLSSGRFSDNVTLIFTTTDLP
ncbi:TPA: hypothetical protein SIA35_004293 [Aeromonas sobria]|nr:hypothetical protein [Aeromonas sobria]